jgi:multisubunit Na+/H+ antiporter MnhG subunit
MDQPDQASDQHRVERLAAGARDAAERRGRVDRWLVMAAGALCAGGVLLVVIGWHGASRTPNVYEQVPYLISGGELGSTLALLGALLYFGRWLAALVREQRIQGAAIVAAIDRLDARLAGPVRPALVTTARGGLVHRADCTVVAGKTGLRPVVDPAGRAACQVCRPEGV